MFYRPGRDPHGLPRDPFKALVTPRPIAWLSTVDAEGRANLAPFSYFNGCGAAPPMVMVAFTGAKLGAHDGERKDSAANIRATREFVVNIVPTALRDAMNATSGHLAIGEDEFAHAGLTAAPCREVAPPRVAESPASLECRLVELLDLPSWDAAAPNVTIIGEVVGVHIDEAILRNGLVEPTVYHPLARMGYLDYASVREVFTLRRPQ